MSRALGRVKMGWSGCGDSTAVIAESGGLLGGSLFCQVVSLGRCDVAVHRVGGPGRACQATYLGTVCALLTTSKTTRGSVLAGSVLWKTRDGGDGEEGAGAI